MIVAGMARLVSVQLTLMVALSVSVTRSALSLRCVILGVVCASASREWVGLHVTSVCPDSLVSLRQDARLVPVSLKGHPQTSATRTLETVLVWTDMQEHNVMNVLLVGLTSQLAVFPVAVKQQALLQGR